MAEGGPLGRGRPALSTQSLLPDRRPQRIRYGRFTNMRTTPVRELNRLRAAAELGNMSRASLRDGASDVLVVADWTADRTGRTTGRILWPVWRARFSLRPNEWFFFIFVYDHP